MNLHATIILLMVLSTTSCTRRPGPPQTETSQEKVTGTPGEEKQKEVGNPDVSSPNDNNNNEETMPKQDGDPSTNQSLVVASANYKPDSLYLNCLSVRINDGDFVEVGCNKGEKPEDQVVVFKDFESEQCNVLHFQMKTFAPINTNECIEAIQANRLENNCDYEIEAFRVSDVSPQAEGDGRFILSKLEGEPTDSDFLAFEGQYEDSDDEDYDDYQFTIESVNVQVELTSYLNNCQP